MTTCALCVTWNWNHFIGWRIRLRGGDAAPPMGEEHKMSFLRKELIPNGDIYIWFFYYKCDRCGKEIPESYPHYEDENLHYCLDCSFIEGKISERKYLDYSGVGIEKAGAAVRDGKVVIYIGKPPWERTNQDERHSKKYKEWRTAVFERDNYTCQHCGQVGGELNAHHIKPFAKYKELRFELSNGITLCVPCHDKVHGKKRRKGKPRKRDRE